MTVRALAPLWISTVVFASGASALYWIAEHPRPTLRKYFEVKPSISDGQVRLEWDPHVLGTEHQMSGLLEVNDGNARAQYPVPADVLSSGQLQYRPRSSDVTLMLTVLGTGETPSQAAVRVAGPEPPAVAPARTPVVVASKPKPRPKRVAARNGTRARRRR